MAGFWGGLANVAAKGAAAYGEQQQDNRRALLIEKARQDALARRAAQDARQVEQDQIAADDRKVTVENRERERERQRLLDEANGIVYPSTTITATSPAPRLNAGAQSRSPLTTPVTEGSLGAIPRTRVTQTPGGYDPTKNKALIAQAARDMEIERRQIEREGRQNAQQDKRDARREAGLNARDNAPGGTRESLTRFDAPLQRAVLSATAAYNNLRAAAGQPQQEPSPEALRRRMRDVLAADPALRQHFKAGRITDDMIHAAIVQHGEKTEKKKPEETPAQAMKRLMGEDAGPTPVAAPVQSARPVTAKAAAPPDDIVLQLDKQFNGDEAKIRAELIRLKYDPDA